MIKTFLQRSKKEGSVSLEDYNNDIDEMDNSSLFDEFFNKVFDDCISLSIPEINFYAHNSGSFDTQFAKKSKVVKFETEISNGNKIKCIKLSITRGETKLKINLLDTLPFTLQPLKDACETFKTEICKEEFDIINKSKKWYYLNSDETIYNTLIKDEEFIDNYIHEHLDRYAKVNYKLPVLKKDGKLKIVTKDKNIVNDLKREKEAELNRINSGYKDWSKYLSFDVRSLSNLIFNVENLYNELGFSITNYVGLPGIAIDMLKSYCYNISKLYVPSDPSMVELCHASIYGGKVNHFHKNWDSPLKTGVRWNDDIKEYVNDIDKVIKDGIYEDYLISIDMNSEYPSMMYAAAFPVGKPEIVTDLENFDKHIHYIGEFSIDIPNIRYAIHPYRTEKGCLLYPSNQTIIGVYNDVDIRDMMKDGYKVRMLKGIYWKKSSKIFSNLIEMLYNKRAYFKSLNPDDPNYAKEYLYKICLNAMFGKFNETIRSIIKFFSGTEDEMMTKINKKSRVITMENGQYRIKETLKVPRISKPTYIAGYITAYSRTLLNEVIRKVGSHKIFYNDTDSVYIKYSDYTDCELKCSNGLCGFKNDYGEGVMITKARFLDIKRCYFEFRNKVTKKELDIWGNPKACCKDPITKKVNEGEEYYVKTFKFKYTGINFKDIVTSSALEPDNKLYSTTKTYEVYNKIMENTSKIVDKFIDNNIKGDLEGIKFIMKRFQKNGHQVTINLGEFAFTVTPEKRGQWIDNEYYAIGFDKSKKEEFLYQDGEIGDIVNKFKKYTKTNYGFMMKKEGNFLRSKRPLFYNIRMHIEHIKEKADIKKTNIKSNNEFIIGYNDAKVKSEYIQKIFDQYLEYLEGEKDVVTNSKYLTFLNGMSKIYIDSETNKKIEPLINNDVIYDKDKKTDTDYYIEFFEDLKFIKKADYNIKYRILSKMEAYNKEGKISEYYIPNYINVKGRAENINMDKLYPVIMLSTRFNEELGINNLENWQALTLIKNYL